MSDWSNYVQRVASNDTSTAIAERTGINQSSIYRWIHNGASPSPAHAAKFATAYRHNVLDAFIAAGFVTEEDVRPDRDLSDEIRRVEAELTEERARMDAAHREYVACLARIKAMESVRDELLQEANEQAKNGRAFIEQVDRTDGLLAALDLPSVKLRRQNDGEELEGDERSAGLVKIAEMLIGDGSPEHIGNVVDMLSANMVQATSRGVVENLASDPDVATDQPEQDAEKPQSLSNEAADRRDQV